MCLKTLNPNRKKKTERKKMKKIYPLTHIQVVGPRDPVIDLIIYNNNTGYYECEVLEIR
jgi:hypothetical protein